MKFRIGDTVITKRINRQDKFVGKITYIVTSSICEEEYVYVSNRRDSSSDFVKDVELADKYLKLERMLEEEIRERA